VWGQYVDELVQMKTYVDTGSQPLAAGAYYPQSDLLYRSEALTDTSGEIQEAYDTDAYGNTLMFSGPGEDDTWFTDDDTPSDQPACEYIFTGREYDPETQIYFYRARFYQPQLGRFISRDPLLYRGGINLYEYAKDRPVTFSDPQGSEPTESSNCCGPDITSWLQLEVLRYHLWALTLDSAINAGNGTLVQRESAKAAIMAAVGPQLTYYPTTKFKTSSCPSQSCKYTVTITGICVHTSALGNLIYGVLMQDFGFLEINSLILAFIKNGFQFQTPANQLAVEIGWDWAAPSQTTPLPTYLATLSPAERTTLGSNSPAPSCSPCGQSVNAANNHVNLQSALTLPLRVT
jgi:RHS repeat-associated protein